MSEGKGVDYEKLARKFINIERGLGEDPSNTLDQLMNIAKRDATWQSVTKKADADSIQEHYDKLVQEVRNILNSGGD